MKAVQISGGTAQLVEVPEPDGAASGAADGDTVTVDIAVSSICGSDLHLIDAGFAEGQVLGHEFAGYTPDGTAVAVEPIISCGGCVYCESGHLMACTEGGKLVGVGLQGGMAERIAVPADCLVPLPSGLSMSSASLVEPLAVAAHSINRARVGSGDRVLVIGAGPIGLAAAAVLGARGIECTVSARHDHQRAAADQLGAATGGADELGDGYDVVIDAAGTTASLDEAAMRVRPMGRIGLVGTLWSPAEIGLQVCMRECEIIPSMTYVCRTKDRNFTEAAQILADGPEIADAMITHRFPLDGCAEAFTTAADRRAGAIKVAFDIPT